MVFVITLNMGIRNSESSVNKEWYWIILLYWF